MNKHLVASTVLTAVVLTACTTTTSNTSPTPQATIAPSSTPAPAAQSINQADWKTHTTADYSINYPSDWSVSTDQGQTEIYNPKTMVNATGNGGGMNKIKTEYVNIVEKASTQAVKQYVDNMLKTNPAYKNISKIALQREEIKINDVTAEILVDAGEGASSKVVYISNGSKMFTLYTSALDIHNQNNAEAQTINSLKFTK